MKHFPQLQRRAARCALLAFAVLSASAAAAVLPPTASTALTGQRSLAPSAVATRQVTLPTKDLVYDPVTQRIYASVPGSAGGIGNSITAIDPVLGTVGASVSIGSEPGKLAISSNSQYIYAALDGIAAVRRFDLTTQTAGLQFALGTGSSGTFYAEDLAVLPGQPNSVAISRKYIGTSPRHAGVGVYDNGVARAITTATHTGSNVIEASTTAATLYGYNNESTDFGFRKMNVDASGVSVVSNTRNAITGFGADIAYDNGLIYATSGQVIDAETAKHVGRFPGLTFPAIMLPDSSANTVYFICGTGVTTSLKAFNQTTFVQTGQLALTSVSGTPGSLIKWGTDGLAFRTSGNQVVLVSTSEILPILPTPIPTPTQVANGISRLSLLTSDLVYDPNTAKVYATLPGSAGTFGNSIAPINPVTGTMDAPVFIGSEPGRLAISANQQFIYAGLNGAAGVRRFDVASQTAGIQFNLGADTNNGPFTAEDIAVLPDNPNAVAVSRRNTGISPRHQGVGIYDNGVVRTNVTASHTGSNVIEFSASAATLYGYNNESTEFGLRKMAVNASGVSVTSTNTNLIANFDVDIKFDSGRIYSSTGRVVDPEAGTILGTFAGVNTLAFVPDSNLNRAFFVIGEGSSATLRTFNLTTFQPAGLFALPGITGTPLSLVRWGTDGLALRTSANEIYFIQTSLLTSASGLLVNSLGDEADSSVGDARCDVDGNLGNGDQCTLRAAIQESNATAGGATITFAASLNGGTIVLNSALDAINDDLSIIGPGAGSLGVQRSFIVGTPEFRIFTINSGKTVNITGLGVSNGLVSGVAGGGISNSGTLTLSGVTVFSNTASGATGGGIQNQGTLTVTNCLVTGNVGGGIANSFFGGDTTVTISGSAITANIGNGGLYNNGFNSIATMVVHNSTISSNSSTSSGGGVFNGAGSFTSRGILVISNSTISGNSADGGGGGLYSAAVFANAATEVTINNSTISGNSDSSPSGGGGIQHLSSTGTTATLTINNGTIFGNNANGGSGGGILTSEFNSTTNLNLRNTIVAGNLRSSGTIRSDISGTVAAASSFNLIGDGTDMTGVSHGSNGNQVGTSVAPINPQLGPLEHNGGLTQTHRLLVSSPALDAAADVPLTTLNSAISNSATSIDVADAITISGSGGFPLMIDSERLVVLAKSGNTLFVLRGTSGTTAVAHANGANLYPASDQRGGSFLRKADSADVDTTAVVDIGAFELHPSIEDIADQTLVEDQSSLSLQFNLSDAALINSLTITSSNSTLIPDDSLHRSITGSGSQRTLTIVPAPDANTPANGTSTITVTATATNGQTYSESFLVTVTEVNDAVTAGNDTIGNVPEDSGIYSIPISSLLANDSKGPANESGQTLTVINVGSATGGTVSINGANIDFSPTPDFNGPAGFDYTIQDDGTTNGVAQPASATAHVSFNVTSVNDVPSFTKGADQSVPQNSGAQTVSGWATNLSAGPPSEVGQTLNFIVSSNNFNLFSVQPAISATGTLTYTPAANKSGIATVSVRIHDNGGVANGGQDTSAIQTFTINVACGLSNLVTNTNDSGAGSLRNAIGTACSGDTITLNIPTSDPGFSGGVYTIALTSAELKINQSLTITGPGAQVLTVRRADAAPNFRIFKIEPDITVNLSGLTISNGLTANSSDNNGGGIYNRSTLTLADVAVSGNRTSDGIPGFSGGYGGGIYSFSGALKLTNCTVSGNRTGNGNSTSGGGFGGGIYARNGSPLALISSTVSGNQTGTGQQAGGGGGLAVEQAATITNSTISGNQTGNSDFGNGGGIVAFGALITVTSSTIAGNISTGGSGGGIYGGITFLRNTIVANNTNDPADTGPDLSGSFNSQDYNLIGNTSGASFTGFTAHNIVNQNPNLGPLANNGGPTMTHALLLGSPALDAGDSCVFDNSCAPPDGLVIPTDQRGAGFSRRVDGPDADAIDTVDIGAFEAQVSVADIANQAINEDATLSLPFNVGGAANITSVTASSSNTTLVPNNPANISISGSGSSRTLQVNPAANAFGSSTVTVTVNGSNNQTMTDTFLLTVNSANDAPSFTKGPDQTVNENAGAQTVNNWASNISPGPADESAQTVTFVIVNNSNPSLFAVAPAVSSAGTLTYAPTTGASGSAIIAIAAKDNGGTANGGADTSNSQTFNITVQDGGALQFSSATFAKAEDGGNAVVTVSRTGGSAGEARVNYATTNGTATAGQDYASASGTLIFANGVTTQSFNVAVTNDDVDEPDETINLTLTTAAGTGSLGTPATAVLTINDNDPAPGLSIDHPAVNEGNSGTATMTFTVTLSGSSSQTVTVNYATADDTATAGSDYVAQSGTLTFLPLESTKTINVTVNGDIVFEPNETFFVNLTNPVNAGIVESPGGALINNDDAQGGLIAFSQSVYTVAEGGGFITITVNRSNDLSGAATVQYFTREYADSAATAPCNTVGDFASSRCDYTTASGTLSFAAGETTKTFIVLISQDNFEEDPESTSLTLAIPTGGALLGNPSTAELRITDDATEPAGNPSDSADAFVRQHYHDFLNREADAAGLAFWTNQITECQQPGAICSAEVRRVNVSAAFFLSIEFQETGYLVYRFYKSAYGDISGAPVPLRISDFLPDTQQIGKGVVIGQPGAEQQLEINKTAYALDFVSRSRFTSEYPTTLTPAEFVDALFANAGVTPSTTDRDAAINEFAGAGNTANTAARARALRRVAENSILRQQETNKAFVLMQYYGYLRRNPYDPPEAGLDYGGYNFWLGKLNEFNGNFVNAEMVKAFIVSGEYRHRFGP